MSLDVYLRGRLVGRVEGTTRNLRFTYDPAYLEGDDPTPLSLSMPLAYAPYTHASIDPYLWGLLPDNPNVLRRWANDYGCREGDVLGLLAGAGREVAGAAQYVRAGELPDDDTAGAIDWYSEREVAEHLRNLRTDSSNWHPDRNSRWSLNGAQAKIALYQDPTSGRWGNPHGRTPTTHILKPALDATGDRFGTHDINEHISLTAAGLVGLPVAETKIAKFEDQRVLVVTRYDRTPIGEHVERVHQEDACQSLGVYPDRKYESDGGPGTRELADLVLMHAPQDRWILFGALVFNWAIAAPDAHAKNYSMLLGGSTVRVAPLYDIASGLLLYDYHKIDLAQKVGGEKRVDYICRRHWERAADELKLPKKESIEYAESLVATIPDAYEKASSIVPFEPAEQRTAERLIDAIRLWGTVALRNLRSRS